MTSIDDLVPDGRNCNIGTEEGMDLLDKSVSELGMGRSVLIDKNNNVIAGNKTLETAVKNGIKKIVVVETQGDKMVAVRRTDLDINSKKGREMALADNAVSVKNTRWDEEAISSLSEEFGADSARWGGPIVDIMQGGGQDKNEAGTSQSGENAEDGTQYSGDAENATEASKSGLQHENTDHEQEGEDNDSESVICPNCFHEFKVENNG